MEANRGEELGKPVIRIDGGHVPFDVRNAPPPTSDAVLVTADASNQAEQMDVHAAQLARHLRERRREVDHRESHLNARIAQLENDLRVSRLWLQERSSEFAGREAELTQQIAEQDSRLRAFSATELEQEQARLRQAEELSAREDEFRRREDILSDGLRQLQEMQASLSSRQAQLDRQDASLAEISKNLHLEREALQREMSATAGERDRELRGLADQRREFEEYIEQQRQKWELRNSRVDERQAALENMRDDIRRLHRETLEMRLVAEQLWSQLTAHIPSGELTQEVARLRMKLLDEFRFAQQDTASQKSALEELIGRLDEQRQDISRQRDELVGWLSRRQNDLAQHAEELRQQEETLSMERKQLDRREKQWHAERNELQRQLHRLEMRMRRDQLAAA